MLEDGTKNGKKITSEGIMKKKKSLGERGGGAKQHPKPGEGKNSGE